MSPRELQCIWKSGHVQWEPKMGSPEVQSFLGLIFLMVGERKLRQEHDCHSCDGFPDLLTRELVAGIS